MKVWGLTGGVASGKSIAAEFFRRGGIPVIDADQISHDLLAQNGTAHEEVLQSFGTTDRKKLRKKIFGDAESRKKLEKILHPLIANESKRRIEEYAANGSHRNLIYEAALLVETGRYRELGGLIVIETPEAIRVKRLVNRDKIDSNLARKIIQTQVSDKKRGSVADIVIQNSESLSRLQNYVDKIIQNWNTSP